MPRSGQHSTQRRADHVLQGRHVAITADERRGCRATEGEQVMEPYGVVIRQWSCPIGWHRYVKWHGEQAFCIEPGCNRTSLVPDADEAPVVRTAVATVAHSVVTIHLPDAK